MLESLGLLGLLVIGLAAYTLLLGRRVIDDRDQQMPTGENTEPGEVSKEKLGACCGFGLPPMEERKLD